MDRVHPFGFCQRNHSRNVQIRFDRSLAFSNRIRLIRFEPVQRQPVFFRIHSDGAQTQFIRRTENSYGNFTAIRRQQFLDGLALGHG